MDRTKRCPSAPTETIVAAKTFEIRSSDAANQLQTCLDELSKPWRESTTESLGLELSSVNITPPILALLIEILNQPLTKSTAAQEVKWNHVGFFRCTLARPDDDGCCSHDDVHMLASALARRTSSLHLNECPEILECLFTVPQLEMKKLYFHQKRLSVLECVRFGDLIQRSVPLKYIYVNTAALDDPHSIAEGFANAYQLQSITFKGMAMPIHQQPAEQMSTSLARDGGSNRSIVSDYSQQAHPGN